MARADRKKPPLSILQHNRALKGNLGVYLAYWAEGQAHVCLLGHPKFGEDFWVAFPAAQDCWLPIAALVVGAWENALWRSQDAIFDDWRTSRSVAILGEDLRPVPSLYNTWLDDGWWHVAVLHPRAEA